MAMKGAYPIILQKTDAGYYVRIPDFHTETQGETIVDAMEMARLQEAIISRLGLDKAKS